MSALAQSDVKPESKLRGKILCACCGSEYRDHLQLWTCEECGTVRGWGLSSLVQRLLKPLLNCEGCAKPTRHGFLGVAGVTI